MREFLKGLELDKETIDTIMAEHGKLITEAKEKAQELENKVKDYESKIEELSSKAETNTKVQEELDTLKKQIAEEKKQKEQEDLEATLNKNVLEAIGDAEFVNERTKNAIINEVKTALQDKANVGKSAKDIFETITKDSTDIFKNKNELKDMPDIQESKPAEGKSTSEGIKINPMFKTDF